MKHAYLIIAHNEFDVLELLVSALDDSRNDIYVHIDRKVKVLPDLRTSESGLFLLDKRIDVRWGHVSQIKTELLLFETAVKNGPYEFYHLISGTHLPLKGNDEIVRYFSAANGFCVFSGFEKDTKYQETLKMKRINMFTRNYSSGNSIKSRISQFCWKAFIAVQKLFHIEINKSVDFWKSSNWLSLTDEAVQYIVSDKNHILKRYRFSFCGDEFFVATELMNSPFKDKLLNEEYYLKCDMQRSNPRSYRLDELDELKKTGYLFARKFTAKQQ